ncbi:MAG: DUF255 domain-containing protein [Pseudomonadota bacterium]|nr:DUF255 domain-containing protein [Pseudomonadota bacterium]
MTPTIAWEPWGEAAFARARAEGKPVLLHIGATWCHWCHVMDEGSYPHPVVVRLVQERFVAVRVDTDQRPEVNERYNMGGWPTVAVLDAEGEVLVGRTYVPAQELAMLLSSVSEPGQRWSIAPSAPEPAAEASPGPDAVWEHVKKAFDRYHGGFGDYQKFPQVGVCEWLLDRVLRGHDDGGMLRKTLDGMADGGLWDKEEGAFFRYSTQDDWSEPHYEKMLEDNGRMLRLYTRAAAGLGARGSATWRARAEETVRWALATLWQDGARDTAPPVDTGAFGGSQDADEGYYARPLAERGEPPRVDPTIYAGWNGIFVSALVRAAATWGRPGLAGLARQVGTVLLARMGPDGAIERAPGGVSGLLVDQADVADGWLHLWQHTGDLAWRDAAIRALTFARDHLGSPDGGCYDAPDGGLGLLRHRRRPLLGNAAFAEACWRLGTLTGQPDWLTTARASADAALAEGEPWGFMAANACAIRERLDRPAVTVKVWRNNALRDALLADPHPDVLGLALDAAEAGRLGLQEGHAMACTRAACARPSGELAEIRRSIQGLLT